MRFYTSQFIAVLFLISASTVSSQVLDFKTMKKITPRSIGPAAMSGRVTAIDLDIKNNIFYAGAASGGVWKSVNGGTSWQPIFDEQSTQSIGAVAVNQTNPAEIWVGTGEGNPRNSQNFGDGIYKSDDGGKSWSFPSISPHGYRSCVEYISKNKWISCGLNGVDYSANDGKAWQWVSKESFNVCRKAKDGKSVFLAGNNGKVALLSY